MCVHFLWIDFFCLLFSFPTMGARVWLSFSVMKSQRSQIKYIFHKARYICGMSMVRVVNRMQQQRECWKEKNEPHKVVKDFMWIYWYQRHTHTVSGTPGNNNEFHTHFYSKVCLWRLTLLAILIIITSTLFEKNRKKERRVLQRSL